VSDEKPMTCAEAGKKGATVTRSRYGEEQFRQWGRRGGAACRDNHAKGYYAELGRKGGSAPRGAKAVAEAEIEAP
jgi:hypothetical protein